MAERRGGRQRGQARKNHFTALSKMVDLHHFLKVTKMVLTAQAQPFFSFLLLSCGFCRSIRQAVAIQSGIPL